jgi:hypothetical protein
VREAGTGAASSPSMKYAAPSAVLPANSGNESCTTPAGASPP